VAGALSASFIALASAAFTSVATTDQAEAYPSSSISLTVHGFGHGRGMGQYGALGYALNGSTWQQIVSHYYGSLSAGGTTTIGALPTSNPEAQDVRVDLTWNDGQFPIVTSSSAFSVGANPVPAGGAAEIVQQSATSAAVYVGPGCGGPWPAAPTFVTSNPVASPTATEPFPDDGSLAAKALQLCRTPSNELVRGSIEATQNSSGANRTVDVLPLDWYVADSAAAESPGSWGTLGSSQGAPQGEPWGFQQTEAQVVATRSYAASAPGGYGGYADICDSTACQSYPGVAFENVTTDAAVLDTESPPGTGSAAGEVVLLPEGGVARTEYSSSSGGYSAPGTFQAVPDDGDSVCEDGVCNPYHQYQVSIPVSAVTSRFAQIGTLQTVDVTQRNGYGDFGGRVLAMSLVGSAGSVSLTGDQFASDFASFGLDGFAISDWFEVTSQPSGGVGGYWMVAADGGIFSFGDARFYGSMGNVKLNQPVVGMAATSDHAGYWLDASDGGIFSFGDARFYGSMGNVKLNQPVVGMAATPDGGGYWMVAADGGIFSFGDARFYGSMGNVKLNQPVVGMAATPDGGGYWMVAADGGIFSFGDARFYGSMGNVKLNQPVVGMAATPDGGGYWMVAADGGIFSLGDAAFVGSLPGISVRGGAVAVLPTSTGGGYLIVTGDGRGIPFGDAPQFGDVSQAVPGYSGHLVGGATVPG
jgi:hypothetical protein